MATPASKNRFHPAVETVKPTRGLDNRTASFPVDCRQPKATRLDSRCPRDDVNPCLAMQQWLDAVTDRELKRDFWIIQACQ